MASDISQTLRSKGKKRRRDDSDEDWAVDSNLSTTSNKSKESKPIPRDTSTWKPYILDRLHLRWDDSTRSPEELLNICSSIPPLNEELKDVANYITEKINIDFPFKQLKAMSLADLDSVGQKLVDIKSNLQKLATVGNYSQYKSNVHTHGQVFVETVKKLIYFVSVEEASYESLFVPVLREFCKACSFLGCDGVVKRELIIEGCAVAAFPDLEFQAVKLPFSSLRGYVTVSIAEVKTCDYSSDDVHKEKPKTRSNSEQGETVSSKFVPWEIKGAAQHAGQLLLEAKRSAFKPFSYGLLFTGSKIIMTCLEVSPYYFNHVGERLREHDKGKLYYSDMFDIFIADDRKVLVKAFLRLAHAQSIQQDTL